MITFTLTFPIFKILLWKKERFPKAFKFMKFYAKSWLFLTGIFVKVSGKENLKTDEPTLICANHSSFIDIPVLYSVIDDYFIFTGKKEIEKWPLFHIFYTSGMNILVDRHNEKGDMKAMKRMIGVIDDGNPLFVFPEGTISKTAPKMTDFKMGAVSIAIRKQVPILPITFTSNWKRLQRKGFFAGQAGPGISNMIIHPPISTKGLTKKDAEELNDKIKSIINAPLIEKYGVD
jgi:1-acyl-sn-glycerol-3-phosphate acyltransferase